jgi:hypothetical protein
LQAREQALQPMHRLKSMYMALAWLGVSSSLSTCRPGWRATGAFELVVAGIFMSLFCIVNSFAMLSEPVHGVQNWP